MSKTIIVHTSDSGWLDQAVRLHLIYGGVEIEDDAEVGVGRDRDVARSAGAGRFGGRARGNDRLGLRFG